jgi:23S rRNA pseudouridine2605 synthase
MVAVDGRTVAVAAAGAVYLLHKPAGYITTLADPQGRPTISEFIKGLPGRLYPVGRLDRMTSGLLLLTDDGALCHRLTHPSFGVEKEYRILADAPLTPERRHALERGVRLEDGITPSPARVGPRG